MVCRITIVMEITTCRITIVMEITTCMLVNPRVYHWSA